MGEQINAKPPLFLPRNVRKYKELCLREIQQKAIASNQESIQGHEKNGDTVVGSGSFNTSDMNYVDQSLFSFSDLGSGALEFYHSWPVEVTLRSRERNKKWKLKLQSNHCPFCKPSGRCRSVKELIDHLDTFHSHLAYSPRIVVYSVLIYLRFFVHY